MRNTLIFSHFISTSFLLALALVSPVETGLNSCPKLSFPYSFPGARRHSVSIPTFFYFFVSFHVFMRRVGLLAEVD
ncbi:hypothetical protein BDW72DRAFT_147303 [Aspergillus terricola var. indicus]